MNLLDIVSRSVPPQPWSEGDNIPWHDPDFSERMLKEHLSQEHDAASRRGPIIDQHVAWLHAEMLSSTPAKVLDLGCGPGLYTSRLARLGHECVGIDYSPASIAHATEEAGRDDLRCEYRGEDMRRAEYGGPFDLVMLINGEFNVFAPDDIKAILRKCRAALAPGGKLVLEPHIFDTLKSRGEAEASWYAADAGMFSDRPHVVLEENFWHSDMRAATTRFLVIDAATGEVTTHAASYQAYTKDEYRSIIEECGFGDVQFHDSLTGQADGSSPEYLVIVARA